MTGALVPISPAGGAVEAWCTRTAQSAAATAVHASASASTERCNPGHRPANRAPAALCVRRRQLTRAVRMPVCVIALLSHSRSAHGHLSRNTPRWRWTGEPWRARGLFSLYAERRRRSREVPMGVDDRVVQRAGGMSMDDGRTR